MSSSSKRYIQLSDRESKNKTENLSGTSSSFNSTASQSSVSSSVSKEGGGRPKKRKRSASEETGVRVRNPTRFYSTNYHNLFNKTIQDLQPRSHGLADEIGLKTSRIGISTWSPDEKAQFFRGIARHSWNNLPAIAALIGTKTELEVHVYLRVLQEASKKQHKYGDRRWLIGPADITTAVEISDPCCASLEQAADAMAVLQQRYEEHHEKERHGELWRLDRKMAQWADQRLSEGEEGRIEVSRRLPAAEILDLSQFLELSTNIFMNSNESHNNYRSFVSRSEKPSMLYTAFADLHTLVLSVTKRLIQSSLFFAMSRLRTTQTSHYAHKQAVKQADVLTACRVLGMKHSIKDYWIRVPRRCKLNVHDLANARISNKALDYNEVERALTYAKPVEGQSFDAANWDESCNTSPVSPEEIGSELESQSIESSSTNVDWTEDSPHQSGTETDFFALGERFGDRVDLYLEHVDQNASEKEELRLWKMLSRSPPPDISIQKSPAEISNPGPYRKNKSGMDNWRDWLDFRPEWETCNLGSLENDFAENGKQMRVRFETSARRDDIQKIYLRPDRKGRILPSSSEGGDDAHYTTSASNHMSTSPEATFLNKASTGDISVADEEDFDESDHRPDDEYSQELEEDFRDTIKDRPDLPQLSEQVVQTCVVDDGSPPPGEQRLESGPIRISSSEDEEESGSESEYDDRNKQSLERPTEEYSDSISNGSDS